MDTTQQPQTSFMSPQQLGIGGSSGTQTPTGTNPQEIQSKVKQARSAGVPDAVINQRLQQKYNTSIDQLGISGSSGNSTQSSNPFSGLLHSGALPVAGGIGGALLGGLASPVLGPLGPIGGAGLGATGMEAIRQLLSGGPSQAFS